MKYLEAVEVVKKVGDGDLLEGMNIINEMRKPPYFRNYNNTSAFYNPNKDEIGMPPKTAFFKTADATQEQNFYGTLFHELTHWTGHTSRNDRLIKRASRTDYAFEELVAELGACFQSVHFGIETAEVNADHIKYLNGWLQALKDDKQLIFKASAQANKVIQYIEGLQTITE